VLFFWVIKMVDIDDAEFKAEIDQITKNINETMRNIERVVPLNSESDNEVLNNSEKSQ